MKKVLDFLAANPVFQLATVDGDQPRCRPFGFHMEEGGRLYFITGDAKEVARQLRANPKFEISVSNDKGQWLRLRGHAVFDTRKELLDRAFGMMPMLKDIYGNPDGPQAAMFYLKDGVAILADMEGNNETINL